MFQWKRQQDRRGVVKAPLLFVLACEVQAVRDKKVCGEPLAGFATDELAFMAAYVIYA